MCNSAIPVIAWDPLPRPDNSPVSFYRQDSESSTIPEQISMADKEVIGSFGFGMALENLWIDGSE
jgi:hypothetical protein